VVVELDANSDRAVTRADREQRPGGVAVDARDPSLGLAPQLVQARAQRMLPKKIERERIAAIVRLPCRDRGLVRW
jgi:hypothetical protein